MINVYLEGGGDRTDTRARLRDAFAQFLQELRDLAKDHRVKFRIVACGNNKSTFDDFCREMSSQRAALNVLLVDADAPVTTGPWLHLHRQNGWNKPRGVEDRQCHLMVQAMEAWLIADREALRDFYDDGELNENPLPNHLNVEQIPKDRLAPALREATRRCQKGRYDKGAHAPKILGRARLSTVVEKAPHCGRLVEVLREAISSGH
jgi:hypothetical protein